MLQVLDSMSRYGPRAVCDKKGIGVCRSDFSDMGFQGLELRLVSGFVVHGSMLRLGGLSCDVSGCSCSCLGFGSKVRIVVLSVCIPGKFV